ncbi:chemotaxis protein CheW [Nocardioides sp. GY 10113]|uniref:chemotaxis protein CheW n=1 Tax=Nocardioides sp. GY 10113 TaxID=2569761 RepID=UPI0010A92008|nr:chemotaxis protein CheW [Nocardioides sp. GY 10113]TIC85964.1 chemotaxis protein CheW [Nocardioides sp. GY 10113]
MSETTTLPRAAAQHCTFWVDGLHFGIDVQHVQEVLRQHQVTVVPRAAEAVRGVINLRGQIVTALDLRSRLRLPGPTADGADGAEAGAEAPVPAMNVVVRSRGEVVSLVVDDIGDVISTGDLPLEPAPATLAASVRDVLHGVVSLEESILLVLDPHLAADVSGAA